ncbi:hypothetical protein OB69_17415 [Roseivirga seohaensis subsp. aquiponti]|uniref:Uncharacterized protein n=1 Tax=Roseivirga seohaensis subsp. aquiponti TaxID=1566026 RepID=A0A0L8AGN3_9BACT|nr:hypothetical protein [Roseivirga seohaensis]KOF01456.1 hypothetical protein OB69_17415 [Roseivirga seohaensis subsp. aquiponti]
MGNQICGILINSLPREFSEDELDSKKLKTKIIANSISSLSPKDLSITFSDDNTYIFLDQIFYKNISEEDTLTDLESDLVDIFPESKILIVAINDTVDFTGYSLIKNGIKIRTKAVVKDQIFLDYGDIYDIELKMLEQYHRMREGKPRNLTKMRELYPVYSDDKLYVIDRDTAIKFFKNRQHFADELPYFYKDGTSDNLLIEKQIGSFVNSDIYELEKLNWVVFQRRKLNFKKDSLKEYIYLAKK